MHGIKILLLEKIHPAAQELLRQAGVVDIDTVDYSLSKEELLTSVGDYHILGIRSRTQIDVGILQKAHRLQAIGCFCIGTNQVDIAAARKQGVVVFNSPYANTRSVAELVIAETVFLMRGISHRDKSAHQGIWLKNATDSFEVRGKTFGIIGYGNIGSQVGLLAEAMGMQVVFHDIQNKLPLGNARACSSLQSLLASADVVSVHVPKTKATRLLLNDKHLRLMRAGSYLINAARGDVVDVDALRILLEQGHIKGAALDVFPVEPASNEDPFVSPLQGIENVILTPHIGGSTKESQQNIALDVAQKLLDFSQHGDTSTAVGFPRLHAAPQAEGSVRLVHIHRNQPGMLERTNAVFSQHKINIDALHLQTDADVGYVLIDVGKQQDSKKIRNCEQQLMTIEGTIATYTLGAFS